MIDLVADIKPTIPRYCRVNRVVRDIPSTDVVAGNKRTSLRLDIQKELARRGTVCECIRCREVRGQRVNVEALQLDDLTYSAGARKSTSCPSSPPRTASPGSCACACRGPERRPHRAG